MATVRLIVFARFVGGFHPLGQIIGASLLLILDLDQCCSRPRLLEGLGHHQCNRLMVMLDLRSSEELRGVVFALSRSPTSSVVTTAMTPGASFACTTFMEVMSPLEIAEPTG